jgi:hypothetical protein
MMSGPQRAKITKDSRWEFETDRSSRCGTSVIGSKVQRTWRSDSEAKRNQRGMEVAEPGIVERQATRLGLR